MPSSILLWLCYCLAIELLWSRDVADKKVRRYEMEYLLQHIKQNILDGLCDHRVESISQHAPVVVEELVGAVLCKVETFSKKAPNEPITHLIAYCH